MMNDEFVPHNSNGGWDVLNKWVSMLKEKGGVWLTPPAPPKKKRIGVPAWFVSSIESCIVFCMELKCVECYQC